MDIAIQNIFLPTQNKAMSLRFMTAVFDCEIFIDTQANEYTNLGGVNIYFLERDDNSTHRQSPFCSFAVRGSEDLTHIKQKIEFFCYREGLEILPFQQQNETLNFFDMDGNSWQINITQVKESTSNLVM